MQLLLNSVIADFHCYLPVFILEVMRDRSMRRGGRIGVDVFMVLILCFSKDLLILERGAKIPKKNA